MRTSCHDMIHALDQDLHRLQDGPVVPPPPLVEHIATGGRPRIHIDLRFLRDRLPRGQRSEIAKLLKVSSRTVRRRSLEHRLAAHGPPVFNQNGRTRVHNPVSRGRLPTSHILDEELDTAVALILRSFPNFGRINTIGQLRHLGIWVSRERVRCSLRRIQGFPAAFGRRNIQRRTYRVAGPNSLWHHDGQHGTCY
jgi:hypothetical protein